MSSTVAGPSERNQSKNITNRWKLQYNILVHALKNLCRYYSEHMHSFCTYMPREKKSLSMILILNTLNYKKTFEICLKVGSAVIVKQKSSNYYMCVSFPKFSHNSDVCLAYRIGGSFDGLKFHGRGQSELFAVKVLHCTAPAKPHV